MENLVASVGRKCPKCNAYGLFKDEDGYHCEGCLSCFDEDKKVTGKLSEGIVFYEHK